MTLCTRMGVIIMTEEVPWYRQLWPWLIIIPPAGAVLGGLFTVWLAFSHKEEDIRAGERAEYLGVPHEPARTGERRVDPRAVPGSAHADRR